MKQSINKMNKYIQELSDEIIYLNLKLKAANKWISVEDSLPLDHQPVIVTGGFGFRRLGIWYTYLEHDGNSHLPIQWEVKHWMPIPNPHIKLKDAQSS